MWSAKCINLQAERYKFRVVWYCRVSKIIVVGSPFGPMSSLTKFSVTDWCFLLWSVPQIQSEVGSYLLKRQATIVPVNTLCHGGPYYSSLHSQSSWTVDRPMIPQLIACTLPSSARGPSRKLSGQYLLKLSMFWDQCVPSLTMGLLPSKSVADEEQWQYPVVFWGSLGHLWLANLGGMQFLVISLLFGNLGLMGGV